MMALVAALASAACRGDAGGAAGASAQPAAPSTGTSSLSLAPAGASAAGATSAGGPQVKIDPVTMKLYRADLCLFASLGLRHLREAYLGSLRGGEPGPGRIPSFDKAPNVDHERQARTCAQAAVTREPAIASIDAPMASFGPLMAHLAEEIEEGSEYYVLKQHERDAFAKGKATHKKLVALFAKLDEGQSALAAGIDAYRAAHPTNLATLDEGERVTTLVLDAGRALVLALVGNAPEKVLAALLGATEIASTRAAERAKEHPDDPWSRAAVGVGAFRQAATSATAKGAGADARLTATTSFARLVEVAHLARASALLEREKAKPGP